MTTEYHNPNSCNRCKGKNTGGVRDTIDYITITEYRTTCQECGFEDYWAYGFYESSTEMESNCERYSFR